MSDKASLFAAWAFLAIIFGFVVLLVMTSCTISMQNVSTKGTTSDLIDENQTASPSTKVKVPVKPSPL